jgi:hypothetical protein
VIRFQPLLDVSGNGARTFGDAPFSYEAPLNRSIRTPNMQTFAYVEGVQVVRELAPGGAWAPGGVLDAARARAVELRDSMFVVAGMGFADRPDTLTDLGFVEHARISPYPTGDWKSPPRPTLQPVAQAHHVRCTIRAGVGGANSTEEAKRAYWRRPTLPMQAHCEWGKVRLSPSAGGVAAETPPTQSRSAGDGSARRGLSAVVLASGRVLFAGGQRTIPSLVHGFSDNERKDRDKRKVTSLISKTPKSASKRDRSFELIGDVLSAVVSSSGLVSRSGVAAGSKAIPPVKGNEYSAMRPFTRLHAPDAATVELRRLLDVGRATAKVVRAVSDEKFHQRDDL